MTITMVPQPQADKIQRAQEAKQLIVLVTGVFDLLHQEHITFLKKARAEGGLLVVGIESDVRVKQIKGAERPVHTQNVRVQAVEALKLADVVFVLPEDFNRMERYRQLVQEIKPGILAVSSHSQYYDVKEKLMAEVGGIVKIVHQHNPAISTTLLLQKQS